MKAKGVISIIFIAVILAFSAEAQIQSPAGMPSVSASSAEMKEEEVKEFFANYIDRYVRKDTEGFLALFSPKAVQNQKEGTPEIRKTYSNFFEQSYELKYQIRDAGIEISENGVEMKARYEITQILRRGGEKRTWKGNATWFLIKEDGGFRILYLNFQQQRSL